MARSLVVFLRGVNVGGHRTFRPALLAKELSHLDVVNIGAAGTFVVHQPVSRTTLRDEIARRLPFETDVMLCDGRDILRLAATDPFAGLRAGSDVVPFVSVLAKRAAPPARLPLALPASGAWGLRVIAVEGIFVLGIYRRDMKAVRYLGQLERLFGVPTTTRNWNTIMTIARALENHDE